LNVRETAGEKRHLPGQQKMRVRIPLKLNWCGTLTTVPGFFNIYDLSGVGSSPAFMNYCHSLALTIFVSDISDVLVWRQVRVPPP
jgi:hypothetical protein